MHICFNGLPSAIDDFQSPVIVICSSGPEPAGIVISDSIPDTVTWPWAKEVCNWSWCRGDTATWTITGHFDLARVCTWFSSGQLFLSIAPDYNSFSHQGSIPLLLKYGGARDTSFTAIELLWSSWNWKTSFWIGFRLVTDTVACICQSKVESVLSDIIPILDFSCIRNKAEHTILAQVPHSLSRAQLTMWGSVHSSKNLPSSLSSWICCPLRSRKIKPATFLKPAIVTITIFQHFRMAWAICLG